MTTVATLFTHTTRPIPPALAAWEDQVDRWCDEYREASDPAEIVEVILAPGVFLFDLVAERVVLAYAVSAAPEGARDASRMRGFPDVGVSFRHVTGDHADRADRGHFLCHAAGGGLDMNLFPQRTELNRGWSEEGKRFRVMERHVASHAGVFYFHRPIYGDETWVPTRLEYGVLLDDTTWWTDVFQNR